MKSEWWCDEHKVWTVNQKCPMSALVSLTEMAQRLKVRPSAVGNYRTRFPDFPKPYITSEGGTTKLWDWATVEIWAARHGLPGDFPKNQKTRTLQVEELIRVLRRPPLGLSLRETGRLIGLSGERVRQIETNKEGT